MPAFSHGKDYNRATTNNFHTDPQQSFICSHHSPFYPRLRCKIQNKF